MLYSKMTTINIKQGAVYQWKRNEEYIPTDKKLWRSDLHTGPRAVVVSNDDVNGSRPIVMVCPISRSRGNAELKGKESIGKLQYISNGVMYTIHCDEIQPVDKAAFAHTQPDFYLSAALLGKICEVVTGMFYSQTALLEDEKASEDYANMTDNPTIVYPSPNNRPIINSKNIGTNLGNEIEKAQKEYAMRNPEPVQAKKKEEPVIEKEPEQKPVTNTITIPAKKPVKKPMTDTEFILRYLSCKSQRDYDKLMEDANIAPTSFRSKISVAQKRLFEKWPEKKKIEFGEDYETLKAGKHSAIEEEAFLRKYMISSMYAATRLFNKMF